MIPKVRIFVPQISKIKIFETKTEFEALLVEARCIRELGPKYNSRLTDDRSPLYIVITGEDFPRVLTARKTDLGRYETGNYYGPFLSGETVRRVLKIARRMFPYCNKRRTSTLGADPRYHFLNTLGSGSSLTSSSPLGLIKSRVLPGSSSIVSKMTSSGQLNLRPCFYRHLGLCPGVCSGEISRRRYLSIIKKLKQFLAGDFAGLKVKLEREMKTAAKRQEFEEAAGARDAAAALASLSLAGEQQEDMAIGAKERMEALIRLLNRLAVSPFHRRTDFRIEGFDVSNLGGRLATAAMAVFIGGIREIGKYRHFRIRGKFTPDDPRMIAEAVDRRLTHPEWGKPDLVVIDGGKPQMRRIRKGILYLGLAKNPDRLVIPVKNGFKTVRVSAQDLGFQLLQQVRDEAHRFSRRLHLKLRRKALVE